MSLLNYICYSITLSTKTLIHLTFSQIWHTFTYCICGMVYILHRKSSINTLYELSLNKLVSDAALNINLTIWFHIASIEVPLLVLRQCCSLRNLRRALNVQHLSSTRYTIKLTPYFVHLHRKHFSEKMLMRLYIICDIRVAQQSQTMMLQLNCVEWKLSQLF